MWYKRVAALDTQKEFFNSLIRKKVQRKNYDFGPVLTMIMGTIIKKSTDSEICEWIVFRLLPLETMGFEVVKALSQKLSSRRHLAEFLKTLSHIADRIHKENVVDELP